MTVTTGFPSFYLEAPDVPAPRGGLLDVVPVTDVADPHAALGVEYVSADCEPAGLAPGLCCNAVAEAGIVDEEKHWQVPVTVCGGPYAVYKAVGCDIFGEPYAQMARDGLERGESVPLEKAVFAEHFSDPTVLTGAPVCPQVAVALLEQYAAANYGGQPVFLTSRFGAVILAGTDVVDVGADGGLATVLGSPVVAAGGLEPDGDTFWLYASGHIHLWRGPVTVAEGRDLETNASQAVAERIWSSTVECFTAAVPVLVPGCSE